MEEVICSVRYSDLSLTLYALSFKLVYRIFAFLAEPDPL